MTIHIEHLEITWTAAGPEVKIKGLTADNAQQVDAIAGLIKEAILSHKSIDSVLPAPLLPENLSLPTYSPDQ